MLAEKGNLKRAADEAPEDTERRQRPRTAIVDDDPAAYDKCFEPNMLAKPQHREIPSATQSTIPYTGPNQSSSGKSSSSSTGTRKQMMFGPQGSQMDKENRRTITAECGNTRNGCSYCYDICKLARVSDGALQSHEIGLNNCPYLCSSERAMMLAPKFQRSTLNLRPIGKMCWLCWFPWHKDNSGAGVCERTKSAGVFLKGVLCTLYVLCTPNNGGKSRQFEELLTEGLGNLHLNDNIW
jgi:hypothetical protein